MKLSTQINILDEDGDGLDKFEDCDDTNNLIGSNHEDCDGDGVVFDEDCDDINDLKPLQDEDCDGFLLEMSIVMTMMIRSTMVQRIVEKSCWHILQKNNVVPDGIYWIDPDGNGSFEVLCDDNGWWWMDTYIQLYSTRRDSKLGRFNGKQLD